MNYYKRHLGDYAKDTADLDALEHGIYNLLLDYYYATEKPLPDDIERLVRIARVRHSSHFKVVLGISNRFFPIGDDGLRHNVRCDAEIALTLKSFTTNSDSAKKRWNKEKHNKINETDMPNAQPSHANGNAIQYSNTPDSNTPVTIKEKKKNKIKDSSSDASRTAARLTWQAYKTAYFERYKAEPIRNAKISGQITQLCKRLPLEEIPDIAAFYVQHNAQFYVAKGHPIGLLLSDAEKLHTEWQTGKRITNGQARQADRVQGTGDMWRKLIEEAEEKQKLNGGLHA